MNFLTIPKSHLVYRRLWQIGAKLSYFGYYSCGIRSKITCRKLAKLGFDNAGNIRMDMWVGLEGSNNFSFLNL